MLNLVFKESAEWRGSILGKGNSMCRDYEINKSLGVVGDGKLFSVIKEWFSKRKVW